MLSKFLRQTLKALSGKTVPRRRRGRVAPVQPELLEIRKVPAVVTATLDSYGTLRVEGTEAAETIAVKETGGTITVQGCSIKVGTRMYSSVKSADVEKIQINGYGGDDVIDLRVPTNPWTPNGSAGIFGANRFIVNAGNGHDTVHGSASRDYINGAAGGDKLYGYDGLDTLLGGSGWDSLYGGNGNDTLKGESETDLLMGGAGNDTLEGGAGQDVLIGESGNDVLDGGSEFDVLDGGEGLDRVVMATAGEDIRNCESVRIYVPSDQDQNDGWSCGPNSASKVLRAYGYDADYSAVTRETKEESYFSGWGLGVSPSTLRDVMRKWKPDTIMDREGDFATLLSYVQQGKPVIALVKVGEFKWGLETAPKLHYYVVDGCDMEAQTVHITNTNGDTFNLTFAEFQDAWNWSDGGASGAYLRSHGVYTRTYLV